LNRAIKASLSELILPCDDQATGYLHRLHSKLQLLGKSSIGILEVLERSLGPAESHPILDARSRLIALARSEGIRAPETAAMATADHLQEWLAQNGLPAVLKVDGTSGGEGVQVLQTKAEARQVFEKLAFRPTAFQVLKQAVWKRDSKLFLSDWRYRVPVVNAQRFIAGRDATISVACWKGEVVASISAEVVKTLYPRGPASVLRLMDNHEMDEAARQLVKRLGLSGIHGFDFKLEEQTGEAHLIEMNARATQMSHLAMGTGHNLPAALQAMLSGEPIRQTDPITEKGIVALFPQEWNRDPASEFFASGFHDVPWDEPGLVRFCVKNHKLFAAKMKLN
jgi:biotin carboxylase